jgi:hypothetical protein
MGAFIGLLASRLATGSQFNEIVHHSRKGLLSLCYLFRCPFCIDILYLLLASEHLLQHLRVVAEAIDAGAHLVDTFEKQFNAISAMLGRGFERILEANTC